MDPDSRSAFSLCFVPFYIALRAIGVELLIFLVKLITAVSLAFLSFITLSGFECIY